MTKADLTHKLRDNIGITHKEAVGHMEALISLMKSTLEQGEKIKIARFGVFGTKQKRACRGRNPQTGETITLDARRILSFKPSAILKEVVNR